MNANSEVNNCSLRELQTEIADAEAFIQQQRFNSNFRPSAFVFAYAAAVLEHAKAFATLAENERWLSIWPILRSQIDAMLWVHEFAVDSISTWTTAELSALDSRISWDKASTQAELKTRVEVWKSIGAVNKGNDRARLDAIESWGKKQTPEADAEWFTTWKMCSQSAHLTGHQIQNLMMERLDCDSNVQIKSRYEPDEETRKLLYRESIRALRFANIRLINYLDSVQNTETDGQVTLKEELVTRYKGLILTYLQKSRGMIPGISTDVPRGDDRA